MVENSSSLPWPVARREVDDFIEHALNLAGIHFTGQIAFIDHGNFGRLRLFNAVDDMRVKPV